ncbi:MAG: hypothetical protein RLZZ618_2145 [Pseudomonadota bacterium]|jgi:hypothetical protein
MNPRHLHDLFRRRFPAFHHVSHDWHVLVSGAGEETDRVLTFLQKNFDDDMLLVHITRHIGGELPMADAARLVSEYAGRAEIRVFNRAFTSFAVIGSPGVATAWKVLPASSVTTAAPRPPVPTGRTQTEGDE